MNRKKIAAIMVFGLTMTTCSTPANGQMTEQKYVQSLSVYQQQSALDMFEAQRIKQTQLEAEAAAADKLASDTATVKKALKKLNSYVNKTWYVFSGSTPSGWDCSGMTLWFYKQVGIELEHRASRQDDAGTKTNDPKPGDLVVFKYNGSKQAYHVGIYIGNGEMIHSPRKREVTRIESVDGFAGKYSTVEYRKFIETL